MAKKTKAKAKAVDETKEYKGILRLSVFAIGGETIGIELETAEGKYDLDMLGMVKGMNGQAVKVIGRMETRTGTERVRKVIVADEITREKK